MSISFHLSENELKSYKKYSSLNLPRHTSYPAVPFWQEYQGDQTLKKLLDVVEEKKRKISLYIHVPFCSSLCLYCGCTKEIYDNIRLSKHDPRQAYVDHLLKELKIYSEKFASNSLVQIHFGGGTPTFLEPQQLLSIDEFIKQNFNLSKEAEYAVEIDPRVTSLEHLDTLAAMGVNRISLGIQDFDDKVQTAVNRVQPYEQVAAFVKECRARKFSINFDLIYGLPFQTQSSIATTLNLVLDLDPDRIAFFRLALIPSMFKWQKSFSEQDLPSEDELLAINLYAINQLTDHAYSFIGLDHFAKNYDPLYSAWIKESLRRNFQGMTTGDKLNIIGVGPSAISQLEDGYLQNSKETKSWIEGLAEGNLPIIREFEMQTDDHIRREVIENLYTCGHVDKIMFKSRWGHNFDDYFSSSKKELDKMELDGLIENESDSLFLTRVLGRLLVRAVASLFDRYYMDTFSQGKESPSFSRLG